MPPPAAPAPGSRRASRRPAGKAARTTPTTPTPKGEAPIGPAPFHTDRRLPGLVRRYKRLASGAFRAEAAIFHAAAEEARDVEGLRHAVQAAQRSARPGWLAYYRRCIVDVGAAFARRGIPRDERQAWGTSNDPWWVTAYQQRLGPENWWTPWLANMLRYADQTGALRVRHIDDATRLQVNRVLRDGVAEGAGVRVIRDRISTLYSSTFSKVRAERIARTEVLNSARAGNYHAVQAAGFGDTATKSWRDSGDALVRNTHSTATQENQGIPFSEPFRVRSMRTGAVQDLMFPGDSSLGADASNVINCRCGFTTQLAPGS